MLRQLPRRRLLRWLLGLGSLVFWAAVLLVPAEPKPSADCRQYFFAAHNLATWGTFADDAGDAGERPSPEAKREPLWPALLAVPILLDSDLRSHPAADLVPVSRSPTLSLRLPGLALIWATALLAAWLACRLGTGPWPAATVFAMIAGNPILLHYANGMYQECLTLPLLLAISACGWMAARSGRTRWWALLGLAAGLLAVSRATFLYPIVLLPLGWIALRWLGGDRRLRRPGWSALVLCMALAALPPGLWMARNHHHFGRWMLSERGGTILAIRAAYDSMSAREWGAAMFYALDHSSARRLSDRLLGPEAAARLSRENPSGFYLTGKTRSGTGNDGPARDADLKKQALGEILGRPLAHAAVSIPLAISGSPAVGRRIPFGFVVSMGILGGCAWAVWRRRWATMLLLAPAAFSLAFHIGITHNIPRYADMVVPLGTVLAVLVAWRWAGALATRWRRRSGAASAT